MPEVLLLARAELEAALDFPSVIDALEQAFHAERRGEWDTPARIAARTESGSLLAMPCGGGSPEALGAKLVTTFPGNSALGKPGVAGLYALFDPDMGTPLAVMDGGYLTLVRTAAVSALATRLMAAPNARTLGVFGAGAQADFHVRLIAAVRPIDEVRIWARRPDAADDLVARLRVVEALAQVGTWKAVMDPREAAAGEVVVTATGATAPVLEGAWLRAGSHVNAIGSHTRSTREIDTDAVRRASTLVVESASTLAEAGDFQMADGGEGRVLSRVSTLGELLDPRQPAPPRDPQSISVFKSCGIAFEDLAVASLAHRRALAQGLGARFAF